MRGARSAHGALGAIDASYAMFAVGMVPVPELPGPTVAQVRAVRDALSRWVARHMDFNFAETSRSAAEFWPEQAYHRLSRIKAAVDP